MELSGVAPAHDQTGEAGLASSNSSKPAQADEYRQRATCPAQVGDITL
jgi:hypothetical protein